MLWTKTDLSVSNASKCSSYWRRSIWVRQRKASFLACFQSVCLKRFLFILYQGIYKNANVPVDMVQWMFTLVSSLRPAVWTGNGALNIWLFKGIGPCLYAMLSKPSCLFSLLTKRGGEERVLHSSWLPVLSQHPVSQLLPLNPKPIEWFDEAVSFLSFTLSTEKVVETVKYVLSNKVCNFTEFGTGQ